MKSQDLLVMFKVHLLRGQPWTQALLAKQLHLSVSEVNHALKRAECSKLYNPGRKAILKRSFLDFLQYGVKYVFPAVFGPVAQGVATAHAVLPLSEYIVFSASDIFVWPYPEGKARGQSIIPIYTSVPQAAIKDNALHALLALVDAVRIGRAREASIAIKELEKRIVNDDENIIKH